ncbi:MAG: thioredoxin [Clostridia bacterium]|nr:thioredoxin [Clostridia bacterium]
MSQNVKEVNTTEFNELLKGALPVVCDFFANWCGPCRMLAPVMDEVAGELKDSAVFVKVNVDENEDLAVKYRIASIPCVKMFKNGVEVGERIGFAPKQSMKAFVEGNL